MTSHQNPHAILHSAPDGPATARSRPRPLRPILNLMLLPLIAAGATLLLTGVAVFLGARARARVGPRERRQVLLVSGVICGIAPLVAFLTPYLMLHGTDNSGAILVLYFFLIVGAWIALLGLLGIAGAMAGKEEKP